MALAKRYEVPAALGAYLAFRLALAVIRLPLGTPGWALALASAVVDLGAIGLPILAIVALVRRIGSAPETASAAVEMQPATAPAGRPRVLLSLLTALGGLLLWLGLARSEPLVGAGARLVLGGVEDLGKVLAASGLGLCLAAALPEPNLLAPASVFAAFADFVVVRFGTVHHALNSEKGRALVQAVSAKIPSIHPRLSTLTVGPADFLFLGILLACAYRFRFGVARNAWALAVVLAASLLLVQFIGALPALAPMCLTFLAWNWKRFALTRQEVVSTVVVLAVTGALFLGYFVLGSRH